MDIRNMKVWFNKVNESRRSVVETNGGGGTEQSIALDLGVFKTSVANTEILLEASPSLAPGSWVDLGVVPEVLSDDGSNAVWRYVATEAIGSKQKEFYRLRSRLVP